MLYLRGHHLICLHFFPGYGYDASFVESLRNVLKRAESQLLSADLFERLRINPHLAVTHNSKSPFNNSQYMIGFDWEERYKRI